MYVVAGLGNPGGDYSETRHNIGFKVVESLAKKHKIKLNKLKFKSIYGEGNIGGKKVILLKPQTFMNNSGIAVAEIARFYKIPVKNIVVVVDDIDIEFASLKIKAKGSAGSHNGLKSVIYHLKDDDFPRVKIGIGKKHPNEDLANFVLSRFSKEDLPYIKESIENAADSIEVLLESGINSAMNKYNNIK